jgi:pyruvate/2-oxoglutarate dehydrogenase complex dihydrolipoamide acyltransferase (E2) component
MAPVSSQNIDFSGVKDGGNFNKRRIPSGDYLATITKVEDAKAKDDTFQYLFTIKIDEHPSSLLPYYCKLQENQLWKLRNIFIAAGKSIPKKRVKVNPDTIVGKKIGVTIEDAEYEGKDQSEISGVFPAAELDDSVSSVEDDDDAVEDDEEEALDDLDDSAEEAEEEEAEDEAEDEVEEDEDDGFDAMDRAALKAALKGLNADFVAKKSQTDDDLRALLRGEDNEPEKPAKAPARAKTAAKPAAKKAAKKPAADVSDEELEELDIDDL